MEDYKTTKKCYGYWTEENILTELKKVADNIGQFPTQKDLKSKNLCGLVSVIKKKGGLNKFRKILGYKLDRLPNGYWTEENIIKELTDVILELHDFPTHTYLRKINKTYLVTAITRTGGFFKYRLLMGYEYNRMPNNYWTKEKIYDELTNIINIIGHFPTIEELKTLNKGSLIGGIDTSGGLIKICMEMNYKPIQKPDNYWTIDNIINELTQISKQIGHFPSHVELIAMKRQDLVGGIYKNGDINFFRKALGYDIQKESNGYWNEEVILNKLKEIIKKLGYFPSRMDLNNINESKLYSAINEYGGLVKYQKILNIPYNYFRNYKILLASYVTRRGKHTEKIVYDILCNYCNTMELDLPKKNVKLSKGNVIEFVCSTNKRIGIDVTNCECNSTVYRKWSKKDYYKYLDELWIVVVSDTFKQHQYGRWNKESPDNVYIMSIEDFCNELEYDLDESTKNTIDKYKSCSFHTKDKHLPYTNIPFPPSSKQSLH